MSHSARLSRLRRPRAGLGSHRDVRADDHRFPRQEPPAFRRLPWESRAAYFPRLDMTARRRLAVAGAMVVAVATSLVLAAVLADILMRWLP